jgi:nicotinamidase-related amidase
MTALRDPDTARTAVLVADRQNHNLHTDGAFASAGSSDHAASHDVVPNVRWIRDVAREAGTGGLRHSHCRLPRA